MVNADGIESEVPRPFIEKLIVHLKDDGLEDILSQTIKFILGVVRTKRIHDDYLKSFNAFLYILSFRPLALMMLKLNEWNPSFVNARSIEWISILGPLLSRTSIFPDGDPTLADRYFGSSGYFQDGLDFEDDRFQGSRNIGDVKSAQTGLRDLSGSVIVIFIL
jgi:ubiquitin conjugation factor E4 B